MALAIKINKKSNYVYCFLGDGELNEGNNWEAFMFAAKYKLDNLVAIVDRNNIQIDGNTEDVMPLNNLYAKFESFNFHVIEISGHDFSAIDEAVEQAKVITGKPIVIIANTIPGKGVREFERDYRWHGKAPNKEEAKIALEELRTLKGKIKSEHQ